MKKLRGEGSGYHAGADCAGASVSEWNHMHNMGAHAYE